MATLPQAADYGPRVKLVSNRIDVPGSGENAVAEALERAAGTFVNMAIQHKEKDDALSYAHAKNEYLIADIEERDKLADDTDWATQTERYNEAMKGHYDRLFPTVRSERDRQLFDAEAGLLTVRGRVAVGDMARVREIDWNVAELGRQGRDLQGQILAAQDAATAREGMSAYLEHINALLKKGFITESQHETWSKDFVTTVAGKRLIAMDPKLREEVLERSITMAKSQGRITRDQIFKGEGSDSIADFIPLDERVKMLEATRKGNELDETMEAAYAEWDDIKQTYTTPQNVAAEVRRRGPNLDHAVRTQLEALSRNFQVEENRLDARGREETMIASSVILDRGGNPEQEMAGDRWDALLQVQKDAIRAGVISRQQRDGFGEYDVLFTPRKEGAELGPMDHVVQEDGSIMLGVSTPAPSYSYWSRLSKAERAKINLDDETWRQAFTYDTWMGFNREQKDLRDLIEAGKPFSESPGLTPMQRVMGTLQLTEKIAKTGMTPAQDRKYWAGVKALDRAIRIAEGRKGEKLSAAEEEAEWNNLIKDRAFTDHYYDGWGGAEMDETKKEAIGTMDPETKNRAREPFIGRTTVHGGQPMTIRMKIEAMAREIDLVPDDVAERDLERAHFALFNLLGTDGFRYDLNTITDAEMEDVNAEIRRRLKGT